MIQQEKSKRALTLGLYALILGLAFLHVTITFPGLTSMMGMDQAQVARNLARGQGYSTQVIRPYSVLQLEDRQKISGSIKLLPETQHPPLQPALWAALFTPLKAFWPFDSDRSIYLLDRVIAAAGMGWLLITLLLAQDMARRMFDASMGRLTLWSLVASAALWKLAVSGSPLMPLLALTTFSLYILSLLLNRAGQDAPPDWRLSLALCAGCVGMLLTHWMAVPLLFGLLLGLAYFVPQHKGVSIFISCVLCLCLIGWGVRNLLVVGDPLGTLKATLLSIIGPTAESEVMRDYDRSAQFASLDAIIAKISYNTQYQFQHLFDHFLGILPACLFFISMLHRFRRNEVNLLRNIFFLMWVCAFAAMSLIGLPEKEQDDNQVHSVFSPVFTIWGLAGMAVLWARVKTGSTTLWENYGYALILIGITAWPMITGLPGEIRSCMLRKHTLMVWPPYAAPRLAKLSSYTTDSEILVADAPWSTAWYADRSSIWLPRQPVQFEPLKTLVRNGGNEVSGFVFSPWSMKNYTLFDQFSGVYSGWNELILRGPVMGIEVDIAQQWKNKSSYIVPYPLGSTASSEGRSAISLILYSDKKGRDIKSADTAEQR
jgi:hypothetical protein